MSKRFFASSSSSNGNSALHLLDQVGVESHVTKAAAAAADHRNTKGVDDNQSAQLCNASDPTYELSSSVYRKSKRRTKRNLDDVNLEQRQDTKPGRDKLPMPKAETISELDSASLKDGSPIPTNCPILNSAAASASQPFLFGTAGYPRACAKHLLAAKGSWDDNLFPDNVNDSRYRKSYLKRFRKSRHKTRTDLVRQRLNERSGLDGLREVDASFTPNSVRQGNNPSPCTRGGKRSSRWSRQLCETSPEPQMGALSVDNRPFDICIKQGRNQPDLESALPCDYISKCIEFDPSMEGNAEILRPGMVLLKKYIPLSIQVHIALRCRDLGIGEGGFYRPGFQDGAKLSLHMMCFGLDWDPQTKKYGKRRNYDDAIPPEIPPDFNMLVVKALHDSQEVIKLESRRSDVEEILPVMDPDVCIANFYTKNGRLGLHQDRDESRDSISRGLPVVSFSIGDSAEFLYGEKRDVDKAERVLLESGDVLIFGGNSRQIFHGVASVLSKTAPKAFVEHAKLRPGRLNLTFRKY